MAKRGKLSGEDVKYIQLHCQDMSLEQIATNLDRTTTQIEDTYKKAKRAKKVAKVTEESKPDEEETSEAVSEYEAERLSIRTLLKNSESYRLLTQEFEPDELRYYEEQYIKLHAQFGSSVTSSEDTQISQAIKCWILMSRNLIEQRQESRDIERLRKIQEALFKMFPDPSMMTEEQRAKTLEMETTIRVAVSGKASRTTEYEKLQKASDNLLKAMKSTRDQRLERIEKEGTNFIEVLRKFGDKDFQKTESRQNELMKMAVTQCYDDLGRPHTYVDGNQDHPILCSDTVGMSPEGDDEQEEETEE
jgi:hypothetical protein